MKKKGFILVEAIMGICLLGILAIILLPLLGFSLLNVSRVKHRDEMHYIGEMVVEKIKSRSEAVKDIVSDLDYYGELIYEDEDFDKDKYTCKLIKIKSTSGFIDYTVIVGLKDDSNVNSIYFNASCPK